MERRKEPRNRDSEGCESALFTWCGYKHIRAVIIALNTRKRHRLSRKMIRPMVCRPTFTSVCIKLDLSWGKRERRAEGGEMLRTPKFVRSFGQSNREAAGAHGTQEPGKSKVFDTVAETDLVILKRF
jgi:hypothetical protein